MVSRRCHWRRWGHRDAAVRAISIARAYALSDPFDAADMDGLTSSVYRELGQLDSAEAFAASSVRKWATESTSRRDNVEAGIALATIHTVARESDD